jgi:hypothetical protein
MNTQHNNKARTLPAGVRHVLPVLGLVAMLFVGLFSRDSNARLEPYYVVSGLSFGQMKPRILFVLDTSGSMSWRARPQAGMCKFDECERTPDYDDPTDDITEQSRIHAARYAIHTIVEDVGDQAQFALMTFRQEDPAGLSGNKPDLCDNGQRFMWAFRAYDGGSSTTRGFANGFFWWLCGDNAPFPYLRWDDLGNGLNSAAEGGPGNTNPTIEEVLTGFPSPMLNTWGKLYSAANFRDVQFFPDFRGIKFRISGSWNSLSPKDKHFVRKSWGDYSTNQNLNVTKAKYQSEIRDQDFYYWPYVDGFTGYSTWDTHYSEGLPPTTNHFYNNWEHWEKLGLTDNANNLNAASLYAPFYLEGLDWDEGPQSLEEERERVLWFTSEFAQGGVDASGGTPWEQVMGPVNNAGYAGGNAVYAHPTVNQYLDFVGTDEDLCVPTATILLTDGVPNCAQPNCPWCSVQPNACNNLHKYLSATRTERNSSVYVVGFAVEPGSAADNPFNEMACAGAGAGASNPSSPCSGTPYNQWDTCHTPGDPTDCAWLAKDPAELAAALGGIVAGILAMDVESGPGTSVLDVGIGNNAQSGGGDIFATAVNAHTEWPDWRGHVIRAACDTQVDGALADFCQDPAPGTFDFPEPTFSSVTACPQSRVWDAGECLQARDPHDAAFPRRIYINTSTNQSKLVGKAGGGALVGKAGGGATAAFKNQLNSNDLGLKTKFNNGQAFGDDQANEIADFIMGVGWKGDWKLPGLANSSPIVVRRIPPVLEDFSPSVGIRDPHCAGRLLPPNVEVADELVTFAEESWDPALKLTQPAIHHEYQEAAIIGSDLGLIHAFQFESGNELFAYLPRYMLETVLEQFSVGGDAMGQPLPLEEHNYGVAATANQGWVWDPDKGTTGGWRHLLIIGSGKGGNHYSVLDVSHMSPKSPQGPLGGGNPLEVLWTTFDPGLKAVYEDMLGETWARPALIYHLPNDDIADLPEASFVIASGYRSDDTEADQGRAMAKVDALTGVREDWIRLPAPLAAGKMYEPNFGAVIDPAVGTHCISRYWAEAQETYFADPSGRFYRWDLGRINPHESDYGGEWGTNGGTANAVDTFRACQGVGQDCTISGDGKAEPFTIPVAVVASNRIDDAEAGTPVDLTEATQQDQFLIAMASGSLFDSAVDGGDDTNDFHSSLYVMVDDHRADKEGGMSTSSTDALDFGGTVADPKFARFVLSRLKRTRKYKPYPGYTGGVDGWIIEEEKFFSKRARPVKAPLIRVSRLFNSTGLGQDPSVEDQVGAAVSGLEVYYIEFTVYEPGNDICDPLFFDEDNSEWHADQGSTYKITMRLLATDSSGFDLMGAPGVPDFGDGQFSGAGLDGPFVEQVLDGNCVDGNCGPAQGTPSVAPCDPNTDPNFMSTLASRSVGYSELRGFNPYERN